MGWFKFMRFATILIIATCVVFVPAGRSDHIAGDLQHEQDERAGAEHAVEQDPDAHKAGPNVEALPELQKQKIPADVLNVPGELKRITEARQKMMRNTFTGFVQDISVAQQYPSQFPDAEIPAFQFFSGKYLHTVMGVNVTVVDQYRGAPLEELTYYVARDYDLKDFKNTPRDKPYLVHLCQSANGVYWLTTQENTSYPWGELKAGLIETEKEHAGHTTSDTCQ